MKISASKKRMISKGVKIAIGSTAACFLADLLKFDYATSAGIITLLSIQDTRKATFRLAIERMLSFILTMIVAFSVSELLGIRPLSFGVFILIMVLSCYLLGWGNTVSANAVFGTHVFMFEKMVTMDFIYNEVGILMIGVVIAVVLNMHMKNKEEEILEYMENVENAISSIISEMADELGVKSELSAVKPRIIRLMNDLDDYTQCAIDNKDITLKAHSEFYINYFVLRKNQCISLIHIYRSIMSIEDEVYKDENVYNFINEMSETLHIHNDDEKKKERLNEILEEFHSQPLPVGREDFEARASLFHILKEFEEFIRLKKEFLESLTAEQKKMYLKVVHEEN